MKRTITVFLFAGAMALAQTKPADPKTVSPERIPLAAEQAAKMADIDAAEAQFNLKVQELSALTRNLFQRQRDEIWGAACQAAGWLTQKGSECQVDAAGRAISHATPKTEEKAEAKPEPKAAK